MTKEELLKGLSEEQIAKFKACKNEAELLDLCEEEGIELSSEQLAAVNGGVCSSSKKDDNKGEEKPDPSKDKQHITNPY